MPPVISEPAAPAPAAKPSTPRPKQVKLERPVLHDTIYAEVLQGENAIDLGAAASLLGWREVEKDGNPDVEALCGQKVVMDNNTHNRYLTVAWLKTIRQEHLRGRWRLNGETIVIGKTGMVLSGQHRLIGLILAELERQANPDKYPEWGENPVTMQTVIVFGIDEADDTFKTLNCGKAGTFTEVLFRSEHFSKFGPSDRKSLSKIGQFSIKLLWERTGIDSGDNTGLKQTHAESMEFLDKHPRLIECIKHIYEEDKDGGVSQYVPPGTAAGLLYLMGASASSIDTYRLDRSENSIDFTNWDNAKKFWSLLASSDKSVHDVQAMIGKINTDGGSAAEKKAVIVKAWNEWLVNGSVLRKNLELKYQKNRDDVEVLAEIPDVGGIDMGADPEPEPDVIPETEVVERKAKVKAGKPKSEEQLLVDQLQAHPGKVLLFKGKTNYRVWGEMCKQVGEVLTAAVEHSQDYGLDYVTVKADELKSSVDLLLARQLKVAIATRGEDGAFAIEDQVKVAPKPKATPVPKPAAAPAKAAPTPKPAAAKPAPKPAPKGKKPLRGGTNN